MKIAPPSTSSRPASIRRAVVLPEPDGPTSTISSPSAISRSSASTAGVSLPGYTRVACSKRTSAMDAHLSGRGDAVDGGAELAPGPRLRVGPGLQVVERQQRGAHDRRRGGDPQLDLTTQLGQPGRD